MKTKTLLPALLLLCLLFTGSNTSAQTPDTVFYRHHIGVNTRVVLDKVIDPKSLTPLQLLYKYQLTSRSVLRLSVEGMYAKSDSSQSFTDRLDQITNYSYGGSIGYEQQRLVGKFLILYYGADINYQQQRKNIQIINNYQNTDQLQEEVYVDEDYTTSSLGLHPFAGLRANLGKRLYLAVETVLSIRSERSARNYYATVTVLSDEGEGVTYNYSDYSTKKIKISHLPINGVNLYWSF